jgi:hypothetical protein
VAAQEQLDKYQEIINSYDIVTRVEKNKIYNVAIKDITNFSTYKCSVFYKNQFIGTSSIALLNSLETQSGYSLVINNGNQVFKYSEAGIAPTSESLENPIILSPLSFTIYDNLGNALDKEILKTCTINWTIPTEDSMLDLSGYYDMEDNNLSQLTELYYDINKKYDISKINNDIQLSVRYKDLLLIAKTNFSFIKEGESGTNGTDFICKIVPNAIDKILFNYPVITNGELNYQPRQSGK